MSSVQTKEELKKLIQTARGQIKADLVIKNCKVIDVFGETVRQADIAISGDQIAGIGSYSGIQEFDAKGAYAAPGFIDSHIHIESSYLSPEELGRLLVPHGGTTIIADPHEIVNVCGIKGLDYMMKAAKNTKLDIKFMLPSCVPATPFETNGGAFEAADMAEPITRDNILGLAEFMNCPGIINCDDSVLDKIMLAKQTGKLIDGHAPGLTGKDLQAYVSARIVADHECATVEEMQEKIALGMYVMVREGSACHNLTTIAQGITASNSRRCVLCSDDRQPKTMLELGHLDNSLRMLVRQGIDPIEAIRMATINAAECFRLTDRGALAPGYLANIVLFDNMTDFRVSSVFMHGTLTAQDGKYLPTMVKEDISPVKSSVHLKDFSADKFKMHLTGDLVHTIQILPGGVVTKKSVDRIRVKAGEFVFDPALDICKVAVVERHQMTGNVACGFLKGYGIKRGAIAVSIAHDSHNIIVVGVSDDEMACAVQALKEQEGGMVLVCGGKVAGSMPMPIAGLMSDQSGECVRDRLTKLHQIAWDQLGVAKDVEPIMTLTFMSLSVIPEVKLTDRGLFDYFKFSFIPVEAEPGEIWQDKENN